MPSLLYSPADDDINIAALPKGTIFGIYEKLTKNVASGRGVKTLRNGSREVRCDTKNHVDNHPSLHISPDNVYFCQSCGKHGGILELIIDHDGHLDYPSELNGRRLSDHARAMLWLKDHLNAPRPKLLAPQPPSKRGYKMRQSLQNPHIAETYPYPNEESKLLYVVHRIEGINPKGLVVKDFDTWQPNPKGAQPCWRCKTECAWIHNIDGVRIVPYRLPELLAACKKHRVVFFVEGERDANYLAWLGLAATSAPFGAGFKIDHRWKRYFAGAHTLAIIPDGDAAGRRVAHERAEILNGAAARTLVLDLWPEHTTDHYDTTDFVRHHLALGKSQERIGEIFQNLVKERLRTTAAAGTSLAVAS